MTFLKVQFLIGSAPLDEEDSIMQVNIVEMKNITKRFSSVIANRNINFSVRPGEVHTLLGENGAGKTTLMNILYGLYEQDEGEIFIRGEKVIIKSPKDAISLGIGMIHQHFMLIPTLTVAENVVLGMEKNPFKLDMKTAQKKIQELIVKYNFKLDLNTMVKDLSVGAQQRVEIIKALYRGADILIMDEPTAVLTPLEVEELFIILKQFIAAGKSIIFISHKLAEVIKISDRITVLRDGEVVDVVETKGITKEELAAMMVGREITMSYLKKPITQEENLLKLENVKSKGELNVSCLAGITFTVRKGEILGVAGVDGNGQKELAEVIMGLRPLEAGHIFYKGKNITFLSTRERIEKGMAHIPADRMQEGLVLDFSVAENLVLDNYDREPITIKGIFYPEQVQRLGAKLVSEFDVRPPTPEAITRNLSGGNQQKVVLARELNREPSFILAMQPTRGLDIGATEFVHQRLLREKEAGAAVLLISADLDEVLMVADRVLVLYEGQIMGEFIPGELANSEIGLLMGGAKQEKGDKSA
jgi:ABC-type uncharacterized transport system ATPase subunit